MVEADREMLRITPHRRHTTWHLCCVAPTRGAIHPVSRPLSLAALFVEDGESDTCPVCAVQISMTNVKRVALPFG